MKSKILFVSLFASTLAFSTGFASSNMQTDQNAAMTQSNMANNNADGEIIGFLVVLNENEITAAKDAMNKKVGSKVKSYAKMLFNDHSKNLKETMKISKKMGQSPVESGQVASLKQEGKNIEANLSPLNDRDFEVAYIDAMVKGHQEALVFIDQNMNNVGNKHLKKHLKTTRGSVQHHLNQAKKIQESLKSTTSTNS
jgi:putative membrane protein